MIDIVLSPLRVAVVHLRLLVQTPAAWVPAVSLAAVVVLASMRPRGPFGSALHERAVRIAMFAASVMVLLWFVQYGQLSWSESTDWRKDWSYYSGLQQAMQLGTLPFYTRTSFQDTDRYIANLETLAAPHAVLLSFVSIRTFFVIHLLAVFAVGFAALIAIKRELELSASSWVLFAILYLLNGHIAAHLSEGHTQWVGYYLTPGVLLALIRVAKRNTATTGVVSLAVTLAALIALGAWHLFVASVLLASIVCVSGRNGAKFLLKSLMLASALSAYRLVPALVTYGAGKNDFLGSFSSVTLLYTAVVGEPRTVSGGLGWHEYDLYVGHVGLALLALGLVPARRQSLRFSNILVIASLILLALSMFNLYESTLFRVPGFVSQRVTTRFAVLTILVLGLVACTKVDAWLFAKREQSPILRGGILSLTLFLITQLVLRASSWRPAAGASPPATIDALKTQPLEPPYFWALTVGFSISAVAAGLIAYTWWHPRARLHVRSVDVETIAARRLDASGRQ